MQGGQDPSAGKGEDEGRVTASQVPVKPSLGFVLLNIYGALEHLALWPAFPEGLE